MAVSCDVSNEESVKQAMQEVLDTYGTIDILLNDAGVAVRGGVHEMSVADWDKSFNVNVKGIFLACKYALPTMMKPLWKDCKHGQCQRCCRR